MRTLALCLLAFGLSVGPSDAQAVRGARVKIRSGGPGKGNADRTRIDVRSGHDRTKIDVRGDRVRVDVRDRGHGHGRGHEARLRAWHGLRARFGPRFALTAPIRLELRAHARRVAWLHRIRVVALSVGDAVVVTRVDGLLATETHRHDVRVAAFVTVH